MRAFSILMDNLYRFLFSIRTEAVKSLHITTPHETQQAVRAELLTL